MLIRAEYIWLDGTEPTQELRSKTRIVSIAEGREPRLADFPEWGYDGSSTGQADGNDSDLILRPVNVVRDPFRSARDRLVLCEVFTPDDLPHATNRRAVLRDVLERAGAGLEPWVGFEQEYTLFDGRLPLGFRDGQEPAPQGPYYCSVGSERAFGRAVSEAHAEACLDAGLMIYGTNAEVMPGQWEFQIGYRGVRDESANPLNASDHLWIGRWLLHRVAEELGVVVRFDNKPMKGDWNGAGNHTNFSTAPMRDPAVGMTAITDAIERLAIRHHHHIAHYGAGLEERLTGLHETCSIDEFRGGIADRGASIRIPRSVGQRGYGYLEDRRPGANCDPYVVSALLVETIAGVHTSPAAVQLRELAFA
jgi:glutamine synthetase